MFYQANPQYDHNDWPIIRWGLCWHLVTHRCPGMLDDPLCPAEGQKALRLQECGELERPGAPQLTHYPLTLKP